MPINEAKNKVKRNVSDASSSDSRVTTDAVHRRFIHREEKFLCVKCETTYLLSELKEHFLNVTHKRAASCVYCGKSVYQYVVGNRKEVYHYCRFAAPLADKGTMFGGALKGLTDKAGGLLEKKKKEAEELLAQKKSAANELLQEQIRKTGELVVSSVSDAEKLATDSANEAKHQAIDAFDAEVAKAEQKVDDGLKQASDAVDVTLKEADQFIDQKREEAVNAAKDTKKHAEETVQAQAGGLLEKASGFLGKK